MPAAPTRCGRALAWAFCFLRLWIAGSWWQGYRKGRFFRGRQTTTVVGEELGSSVYALKNVDLAPDGKRIVALMPVETPEAQQAQSHVIFLENFFDELRRKVPVGK
jgi:hypothetical protein